MQKFWLKLIAYISPFALIFILVTGYLIYIGESMPLAWVANTQSEAVPSLFRNLYGNRDYAYKLYNIRLREPEIIALGSSRVLQIRDGFFNKNPEAFYNAGAPAWQLEEVYDLVKAIPKEQLPEVILLGIDFPWFNPDYPAAPETVSVNDWENLFLVNRAFIQDLLLGDDFNLEALSKRIEPGSESALALGIKAIRDGHGFRNDGSEQYGDFLVAQWLSQASERERHLALMRSGGEMYVYGDVVDQTAINMLDDLLDYANENNFIIIGFFPQYMPSLWEEMMHSGHYAYIPQAKESIESAFNLHGFPIFDYSNGAWIGTTDEEFFDGWHASELANLRQYRHLLSYTESILGDYSDDASLARIENAAISTWDVFGLAPYKEDD